MRLFASGLFPEAFTDQQIGGRVPPGEQQGIPPVPRAIRQGRYRPFGEPGFNPADTFDESQWVRLNGEIVVAVPNGASILALPAPNQIRNFLGFRNSSAAANIFISYGGPASLNSWIRLTPNTILEQDTRIPQDEIFAFADAAAGFLICVQSSTPGSPS